MKGRYIWIAAVLAIAVIVGIIVVIVMASDIRRSAWPAHVKPLAPASPEAPPDAALR